MCINTIWSHLCLCSLLPSWEPYHSPTPLVFPTKFPFPCSHPTLCFCECACECVLCCVVWCVCVAGRLWDLLSLSRPSGKDMNAKVSTESWVTCQWLHHWRRPLSRQPLTSIHFPEWGGVLWASLPSILSVDLLSLVQTLYLFSGQLYLPSTAFPGS